MKTKAKVPEGKVAAQRPKPEIVGNDLLRLHDELRKIDSELGFLVSPLLLLSLVLTNDGCRNENLYVVGETVARVLHSDVPEASGDILEVYASRIHIMQQQIDRLCFAIERAAKQLTKSEGAPTATAR